MQRENKVGLLLPTRNRTTALNLAIRSAVNRASEKNALELLIAFDLDDKVGPAYFDEHIKDWVIEQGVDLKVLHIPRLGYDHLNEYCNILARIARSHYLMMWNDDAIMDTDGWDKIIAEYIGQFKVLKVQTHNEHPNSIFPIVPIQWVQLLGHFSRHKECDNEISQIGYLLDIVKKIPVHVTHDRYDLTGNNNDEIYNERNVEKHFEFDRENSFHHPSVTQMRINDTERVAAQMRQWGLDTSWWDSILNQTNKDPWRKMKDNDPNGYMEEINVATGESVRYK